VTLKGLKVLYIVGCSRSGSTLLQTLLGLSKEILVLGEVRRLPAILKRSETCSCGAVLNRCPFWSTILAKLPYDLEYLAVGRNNLIENYIEKLMLLLQLKYDNVSKFLSNSSKQCALYKMTADIYHEASNLAGVKILVDNSKVPFYFAKLRQKNGNSIQPVYLHRDGRAVVYSKLRRTGISVRQASKQYRNTTISMELLRFCLQSKPNFVFRYEDLCAYPEVIINNLRELAGLRNIELKKLKFSPGRYHFLGGSPSYKERSPLDLQVDQRWSKEMSNKDIEIFKRHAGWINRKLGYN
jgi:hypothetical protein